MCIASFAAVTLTISVSYIRTREPIPLHFPGVLVLFFDFTNMSARRIFFGTLLGALPVPL